MRVLWRGSLRFSYMRCIPLHIHEQSGPFILRPPVQQEKCLKLERVLKHVKGRGIYIENIRVAQLMGGLKMEEIVK